MIRVKEITFCHLYCRRFWLYTLAVFLNYKLIADSYGQKT